MFFRLSGSRLMVPDAQLIYVVDDDDAVRDSLGLLSEAAGYKVELFETAAAALRALSWQQPHCIVTDVRMPEIDGPEFQRRLVEAGRKIPVIVITGHADVPLAVQVMKAGAVEFLENPFSDDTCLGSIKSALAVWGSPDSELERRLVFLTARERQVLDLLVVGHPNKAIAYRLDISSRTVENHRAHVMRKMQVRSLPELVRIIMRAGSQP